MDKIYENFNQALLGFKNKISRNVCWIFVNYEKILESDEKIT